MNPADVPPGPLCLDTNLFSWLLFARSRHADFAPLIAGRLLVLSFATVGELRAGAIKAGWGHHRFQALERAIERCVILLPTDPVTRQFGQIYARFRGRLKSGGVNDMWTAACALAQPETLPIVTSDLADFRQIANEFPLTIVHPDL